MFATTDKLSEVSQKDFQLPQKYNLLDQQSKKVVRLQYCVKQKGKCYHCNEHLDGDPSLEVQRKLVNAKLFPTGFFNHPIHLHHDHDTGMTIGAVHCRCNAVLWEHHGE